MKKKELKELKELKEESIKDKKRLKWEEKRKRKKSPDLGLNTGFPCLVNLCLNHWTMLFVGFFLVFVFGNIITPMGDSN